MELGPTLGALAAAIGLFALASWRDSRPPPPLRVWHVPWRLVLIMAGGLAVMMVVHLVNLLGFRTGMR